MRKVLLLIVLVCLLPSCRGGWDGAAGRRDEAGRADDAFAQGEAAADEGRYDAASVSFAQAREAAARRRDERLVARCCYALGETFNRAFFYDEGLANADSAWHLSTRLGMQALADSSLYQMALSQIGLEEYAEAARLFDRLMEAESLPDGLAAHATAGKAFLAVEAGDDPAQALQLFEQALTEADAFDNYEYWAAYAYCLFSEGFPDKAAAAFANLEEAGYAESYAYQKWRSRTLALKGDWAAAYQGMDRAAERQRSATSRIIRQASFKAQRDYLALENQQARGRARSQAIILILICSVLLLALLLLLLLLRFRNRQNRAERTALLEWGTSMESQRDDLTLSQAKLRADYARIYQSYFQQIGRIREIVGDASGKETGVYYQLKGLIKNIRLDKQGQRQFEAMIDRDLNRIMQHFREDFPNYYEDTYRFISYVFAGFDATTIRILTGMASDAAVHTKKSGIKKAILASDSQHKDQYLLFL